MSLQDVEYHLKTNSKKRRHSLFIYWVDMLLPQDDSDYYMDDWMSAVVSLHGGKIYGYEVAGREAYFFPVHFEGDGFWRQIRYGNIVDYTKLQCATVNTKSHYLRGTWRVAGFDSVHKGREHPFRPDSTPMMIYYQILGIESAHPTLDVIKAAYRHLARQYHPDLNKSKEAHFKMKQINDAYTRILQHIESSNSS